MTDTDEQYVPTDEQMQADWHAYITTPDEENYYYEALSSEEADARWSRWLAAHDAHVRRDAEAEMDSWMARAYEAERKLWKAEARIRHLEDTARVLVKEALAAEDARDKARVKAVEDVLSKHESVLGDSLGVPVERIRRALEGDEEKNDGI